MRREVELVAAVAASVIAVATLALPFACGTPSDARSRPAVVSSRSSAGAEDRPNQTPAEPGPSTPPIAFRTATGIVRTYDRGARLLTIEAATGASRYRVAADARAWVGRRRLPVAELAARVGWQATVAYSEKDGVRTTHTVRLVERWHGVRAR